MQELYEEAHLLIRFKVNTSVNAREDIHLTLTNKMWRLREMIVRHLVL